MKIKFKKHFMYIPFIIVGLYVAFINYSQFENRPLIIFLNFIGSILTGMIISLIISLLILLFTTNKKDHFPKIFFYTGIVFLIFRIFSDGYLRHQIAENKVQLDSLDHIIDSMNIAREYNAIKNNEKLLPYNPKHKELFLHSEKLLQSIDSLKERIIYSEISALVGVFTNNMLP
jgi:hypothetical protein